MSRLRIVAVAALLASGIAAPAVRAGCTAVRAGNGWSLTDVPVAGTVDVPTAGPTPVSRTARLAAYPGSAVAPGVVAGRRFVTDGVTLYRSVDSGCAWQRVYTVDPATLGAAAAGDPQAAVATAEPQYGIAQVGTPVLAPGAKPAKGRDRVYLLVTNGDAFAGLVGSTPAFVARSADGGATWHTDLIQVTEPGGCRCRC